MSPRFQLRAPSHRPTGKGRMGIAALTVAVGALAVAQQGALASSFDMFAVSPGEFSQLPEYCPQTNAYAGRTVTPDGQRLWLARLGPTYWHIHHYCWGLLKELRSRRVGIAVQEQRSLLESAIKECYYVLERAPPEFVLLPEIYLRIGQFHARLGRPVEALEAFERSRSAKADYWPAYLEGARLNDLLRRRDVALALLDAGIAIMPSEQRLLDERERIRGSRGRE